MHFAPAQLIVGFVESHRLNQHHKWNLLSTRSTIGGVKTVFTLFCFVFSWSSPSSSGTLPSIDRLLLCFYFFPLVRPPLFLFRVFLSNTLTAFKHPPLTHSLQTLDPSKRVALQRMHPVIPIKPPWAQWCEFCTVNFVSLNKKIKKCCSNRKATATWNSPTRFQYVVVVSQCSELQGDL